ncbi:uncharacterized protein SCHCODRAFT_02047133 [Schizophyllum commune H4-8]|uniref:uncharacterized protein n=1 Tax=Schizophyllum commune (strain H4-8 / FGSC 9210) TaxID=578458 RepID=UPI00215F42BA|nr:uncharacterized protein SCHCODRAFT_02047133 [Schizophyllum commune H4-8]KAI5888152.1 hypothetical protein SCHCODRAFT_02047133 [Schizophyllum commune H4-8]
MLAAAAMTGADRAARTSIGRREPAALPKVDSPLRAPGTLQPTRAAHVPPASASPRSSPSFLPRSAPRALPTRILLCAHMGIARMRGRRSAAVFHACVRSIALDRKHRWRGPALLIIGASRNSNGGARSRAA